MCSPFVKSRLFFCKVDDNIPFDANFSLFLYKNSHTSRCHFVLDIQFNIVNFEFVLILRDHKHFKIGFGLSGFGNSRLLQRI